MITVNEFRKQVKAIKKLAELAETQIEKGLFFEAAETLKTAKEKVQKTTAKMEDRK